MELHPTTFPESLTATLNCYKLTSIDSLSGPSGYPALAAQMWFKENKQLPPIPPQPLLPMPYFMQNDKSVKRSETMLAGEKIACFIVGGEKRLCLPQILTSVLRDYSITEINQACAELHIYCSRCLPEQLEILKYLTILPFNTAQCGLITKTDAERLVALLMDQHEPVKSMKERLPKDIDPDTGFNVYHECFGKGYGMLYPKMYTTPNSACIICDDCGCLYTPQHFIAHSHRSFEKRTCHWGFDPENWRNYLLIPKSIEDPKREELEKVLNLMKARFDQPRFEVSGPPPTPGSYSSACSPPTSSKRRYDSEQESPIRKKIKEEDKMFENSLVSHPFTSLPFGVTSTIRPSAFRPWSPGLCSINGMNADNPVIQDLSHLKAMLPLEFERRGFSQYLQNGRPVVLGSRASEFPLLPPGDSRKTPNIRMAPAEEQKRALENRKGYTAKSGQEIPSRDGIVERDKNNNDHDHITSRRLLSKEYSRKYSIERSPQERSRKISLSPVRCVPAVATVSPRSRTRVSPARYSDRVPIPSTSQLPVTLTPPRSTATMSTNNNNGLKEPRDEVEIARPISRSREAAATAMLELKAAGSFRTGKVPPISRVSPPPVPVNPETKAPSSAPTAPSSAASKTTSIVVPLDSSRQHYKWTICGHSYIVSAAGYQTLEMLRGLLDSECEKGPGKDRILHELVKMKSLYEEKLDIEMSRRRDLQMELDRLKTIQREKQQASSDARKLIREDVEGMRQEHARRIEEMTKSLESLKKQLKDAKLGLDAHERENENSFPEKEMRDLCRRIQELESKNDKMRESLIEEREKREEVELKLENLTETSRGRIPFLMESPLSSMMRGVSRRNHDEDGAKHPPSSPRTFQSSNNINKKIPSSQVNSMFPVASAAATTTRCHAKGVPSVITVPVNGSAHGRSPNAVEGVHEAPKTVVVS